MREELISFATAKLAKEKGFKNGSISTYHDDGALNTHHSNGKRVNGDSNMTNGIEAPTQSLLERWLREIHKIDIIIQPHIVGYYSSIFHPKIFIGIFASYEEALEKALFEALKLI